MKVSFQIVNVATPNFVKNTVVFCTFAAVNSCTNLHIALDGPTDTAIRSKSCKQQSGGNVHVHVLFTLSHTFYNVYTCSFRGKNIRVFLTGDWILKQNIQYHWCPSYIIIKLKSHLTHTWKYRCVMVTFRLPSMSVVWEQSTMYSTSTYVHQEACNLRMNHQKFMEDGGRHGWH